MNTTEWNAHVAATMSEAALQAQVVSLMNHLNWWNFHAYDSRRSRAGLPDLVAIRGQRIIYRELKTARGRLSAEQREVIEMLTAAGADVAVWRPADMVSGRIAEDLARTSPTPIGGVASPATPVGRTVPVGATNTRRLPR